MVDRSGFLRLNVQSIRSRHQRASDIFSSASNSGIVRLDRRISFRAYIHRDRFSLSLTLFIATTFQDWSVWLSTSISPYTCPNPSTTDSAVPHAILPGCLNMHPKYYLMYSPCCRPRWTTKSLRECAAANSCFPCPNRCRRILVANDRRYCCCTIGTGRGRWSAPGAMSFAAPATYIHARHIYTYLTSTSTTHIYTNTHIYMYTMMLYIYNV